MRIQKWISMEQEVEVDLSSDDIMQIIDRDSDSLQNVLWGLNNIATFLKGISDSKIAELNPEQRKVIGNFLFTESERFNKPLHSEQAIQCPTCKCFNVHSLQCSAGFGKILPPAR